jgi:hypothetical protein
MKIEFKHLFIFIAIWSCCVVILVIMTLQRSNDITIHSSKLDALESKIDSIKQKALVIEKKYKDEKIKVSTYDLDDLDSLIRSLSK